MAETLAYQVVNSFTGAVPREARSGIPGLCPGCLGCTFRCERDWPGNCIGGSGGALLVTTGSVDASGTGSAEARLTSQLIDCVGDSRAFEGLPAERRSLSGALMLSGDVTATAPVTFTRNGRLPITTATMEGLLRWVSGPSVTAGECRVALTAARAADRRTTTVRGDVCGHDVMHTFQADYCCGL